MQDYVKRFAEQGIKIFACNLDKTPATPKGFYNATDDYNILSRQFYKDELRIGLPTGDVNGIVVVDFDINKEIPGTRKKDEKGKEIPGSGDIDCRSVQDLLEVLQEKGEFPDTFKVETPSGGLHCYFLAETTKLSSYSRFFDKTLPIDIRANGGYVCTCDNNGYVVYDDVDNLDIENLKSRCAPLPQWIEDFVKEKAPTHESTEELSKLTPDEVLNIRSALAFFDSDDRDLWIKIGMALKDTGAGDQAKGLWTEWSQKSEKFNPADQEKRWKGFKPKEVTLGTIFHIAKDKGWVSQFKKPENIIKQEVLDAISGEKYKKKPFPKELLRPPGFVGEIVDYMNSQALYEQPILHLGAAFALAGALMGRKYETDTEIRTNIYCVGLGESGCGKENARSCILKILQNCNPPEIKKMGMTHEIASDTAIYNSLNEAISQVFLLDEFGKLLQTTKSAAKSPHLYGIPSVLLKLYGASHSEVSAKSYADTKKNITLKHPNLCIYGTATPEQFCDSLTKDNITEGLVSRMLIFESENKNPEENYDIVKGKPPHSLIEKVEFLFSRPTNAYPAGNVDVHTSVQPLRVPYSDEAEQMFRDYSKHIRELRKSYDARKRSSVVYNRAVMASRKIALIIAIGDCIPNEQPMINSGHADYAIRLTQHLMDSMQVLAESHVSDSEHEQNLKKVLHIIREHGNIEASLLSRKTQKLQSHVRKDIIETLKEGELIIEGWSESADKKKRIYVACEVE